MSLVESHNAPVLELTEDQVRIVEGIDVAGLGSAIFDAVRNTVPLYGAITDIGVIDEIKEHCAQQAVATLAALRQGGPPEPEDVPFVRELASRRARDGVPLSALLHAYRAGYTVVWDRIRSESVRLGTPLESALSLAGVAVGYINAISLAASEAYLREQQHSLATEERTRRVLLETLLAGEPPDTDAAMLLSALGLNARGSLYVMIVTAASSREYDDSAQEEKTLRAGIDVLGPIISSGGAPTLIDLVANRIVALCLQPEGRDISPAETAADEALASMSTPLVLTMGISTAWSSVEDVPRAYAEALRALRLTSPHRPLVSLRKTQIFDDLIGLADATTVRLLPDWAQALLEEDRRVDGELIATLRAYIDVELSVGRAATRLAVHPNTVRYRLQRIEAVTGSPLRSFEHLVNVVASVRILERRSDRNR